MRASVLISSVFGQSRHSFEQAVAAAKNADQQLVDHILLANDDFAQLLDDASPSGWSRSMDSLESGLSPLPFT